MSKRNQQVIEDVEIEQLRAEEEDLYAPPMRYVDPNVSLEADIDSNLEGEKEFARVIMILAWLTNNRTFADDWREFFWATLQLQLRGVYKTEQQIFDFRERLNRNPMFEGDLVGMSPDDILEEIQDFFEGE
jgi:hypothetical protein